MRFVCALGAVLLVAMSGSSQTQVVGGKPTEIVSGKQVMANEVLIQFKAAAAEKAGAITSAQRSMSEQLSIGEISAAFQAESVVPIGGAGWHLLHSYTFDTATLLAGIRSRSDVALVEANGVLEPLLDSVAQYYAPYQWALKNTGQTISGPGGASTGTAGADIKANQAWDLTTGYRTVVIATIDPTGIDYTHPDLSPNIWSAPSSYTVTVGGVQYTCPAGSHWLPVCEHRNPAALRSRRTLGAVTCDHTGRDYGS